MPKRDSRVLKFITTEPVKELIVSLVDALNGDRKGRRNEEYSRKQLILLVRKFQELNEAWMRPDYRGAAMQDKMPSQAATEKVEGSWFAILKILEGYTAFPVLTQALDGLSAGSGANETWTLHWHRADKKPHMDLQLSLDVVETFRAGKIGSLKECEECGKWLYARFPHQRFCSENCKDHFHKFNEADKKRRRDWARENYQSRKELELGSRTVAQRKGERTNVHLQTR
jgi:hypothetical protein